jgi:hypothetical protein
MQVALFLFEEVESKAKQDMPRKIQAPNKALVDLIL